MAARRLTRHTTLTCDGCRTGYLPAWGASALIDGHPRRGVPGLRRDPQTPRHPRDRQQRQGRLTMPMTPGRLIATQADIDTYTLRRRIERDSAHTAVLVAQPPTTGAPYPWALVQYQVGGWSCLAVGHLAAETMDDVADTVTGHYGDGFDRIPADHYRVSRHGGEMIHLRRTAGESLAYCGTTATSNPYVHIRKPGRYEQHCTGCTDTYRAEHYGRCPVSD